MLQTMGLRFAPWLGTVHLEDVGKTFLAAAPANFADIF
jgi:hypothetical protein